MLDSISSRLAELAYQSGLINQTEKEIYRFGFETALLKCVHIIAMLLIGAAFKMPLEAVTFIAVYSSLRIYAGGFHAKSRLGCFLISCVMMTGVLFIVKYYQSYGIRTLFVLSAMSIATAVILFLSPVAAVNKPLDQIEIKHYKKRVYIVTCFHLMLLAVFYFRGLYSYSLIVCLSEISLTIMLIMGNFQLRTIKGR